MSFEYRKSKGHGDNESFWTSYSDLFLGLSSIFLMLYVVASLRTGTDTIKVMSDNQQLKVEVQDLKNQLQTYESVKENYLNNQASKDEVTEYNELMDKLTLLQDEAKTEKESLRQKARENERKEAALNKYQQMVRNIINSNNLAKVKINNRNEIITEKDEDIKDLNTNIANMNHTLKVKEQEITSVSQKLQQQLTALDRAKKLQKISQVAYQARMKQLKSDAEKNIQNLRAEKNQVAQSLSAAQQQLASTQSALESTSSELGKTKGALEASNQQISGLKDRIGTMNAEAQAKMRALQEGYAKESAAARAAFDAELGRQKNLSAGEIARREAEFKRQGEARERAFAGKLQGLAGELENTKGALASTQGKLAAAEAELSARKGIAEEIKKGFRGAGVKADINMESGDVVLDFGQAYFDSDSAQLKEEMRNVLQRAMPVYSKSLFGNPKVSDKISSVEVIGFASPTYQGRVVDPYSSKPQDRDAIKYNMDLSYKRAKSIFNYILDGKEMNFTYHKNLVPAMKVSGRSFLDLMKQDRSIASVEDYCKKNDCKKSQRVIIRIHMETKK